MIWDWIVVGFIDVKLSERIQLDENLTLDKTDTMIWQTEQVKQQQKELRGCLQDGSIEAIQKRHYDTTMQTTKEPAKAYNNTIVKGIACTRCWKGPPHWRFHCPASETKCHTHTCGNHTQVW